MVSRARYRLKHLSVFILASSAPHGLYKSSEKQLKQADTDRFRFFFGSVSYFDDCFLLNIVNMIVL